MRVGPENTGGLGRNAEGGAGWVKGGRGAKSCGGCEGAETRGGGSMRAGPRASNADRGGSYDRGTVYEGIL
jgi:hypothetical protein